MALRSVREAYTKDFSIRLQLPCALCPSGHVHLQLQGSSPSSVQSSRDEASLSLSLFLNGLSYASIAPFGRWSCIRAYGNRPRARGNPIDRMCWGFQLELPFYVSLFSPLLFSFCFSFSSLLSALKLLSKFCINIYRNLILLTLSSLGLFFRFVSPSLASLHLE